VDPGTNPEGRQSNVVGNGRDRLPLDTRPDDLRALHHPVGRRARAGEAFHGIGFLCGQRSHLECHGFPSNLWFGGSIAYFGKEPLSRTYIGFSRMEVSRMRIGIMLQSFCHLGGIGVYTREIVEHLIKIDKNNEYILIYPSFGQSHKLFGQFSSHKNVVEVYSKSLIPHAIYWDNFVIPKFARKNRIDLVFNPFLSVPLPGNFKKIFVMHGHEWFTMPEVFWLSERILGKIRMLASMQASDKIISISHAMTKLCIQQTGLPEYKFRTIYHGVSNKFKPITNIEALHRVRLKYKLPSNFILFIGGIYPQKNFSTLVKAFSLMVNDVPHQLVVAGKARWKYKNDLRLVAETGLEKRIQLLGWIDPEEIPALYNLADCFVYPSLYEGFGLCLVEAMAVGCPVVAASTGALPEIAQDAALLVDPQDYCQMKDAILRVISDTSLREDIVQRGLLRARDFTWEKCAEETLKLLCEVGSDIQFTRPV
jgi:glycosyltransferase involved in cell wall biosynthesis